jgi:spore maturation protein A
LEGDRQAVGFVVLGDRFLARPRRNPTIEIVNAIWFLLLLASFAFAVIGGKVGEFTAGAFKAAQTAFEVALSLVGLIVFWLGLMKIAERSGLVNVVARWVHPALRLLFPKVPRDHPALSAIALNIAANALGLDNAATPLGIKAMEELDKLNKKQATLSDEQALLVALNTAGMAIIPVGIINLRLAAKAKDPYEIVGPTLIATGVAFVVSILVCKLLSRLRRYRKQYEEAPDKIAAPPASPKSSS